MSYEFNPESQTLELPNPYKVENLALFVSSGVILLSGLFALFSVRDRIAHNFDGAAGFATFIAAALLILGIGLGSSALRQLKFYFGRNRPESLAPILQNDRSGDSPQAAHYKETLRQSALVFEEPKGAINGLLYTALPQLIFAPIVIQRLAQRQFQNFLALITIFISFLVCWLLTGNGPANGWIGIIYGCIAYYFIGPLRQSTRSLSPAKEGGDMSNITLVILSILSILGPVVFTMISTKVPDLGGFSINGVLVFALLIALAGIAIFGLALKNQLQEAPQEVGVGRVVDTLTMNAHPSKVMEELDRILINEWFSRIPNRKYTRVEPQVTGRQGQFSAEVFEETQPRPKQNNTAQGVGHALHEPHFRWLAVLTWFSSSCFIAGSITMFMVLQWMLAGAVFGSSLALALALFAIGLFCHGAAHQLWGRFDFQSTLIWVEMNGSFESAQVNIGNQISGNVQTAKQVINIESMTLKVWVSEIETVIFGKDSMRQLIRMRGLQDNADKLSDTLKQFGESRSMVVAPTSSIDLERAQKIGQMASLIGGGGVPQGLIPSNTTQELIAVALGCKDCNEELPSDAKFCGNCGVAVIA